MNLNFKRLDSAAILPKRANPTDSGLDLHAIENVVLLPGVPTLVRTGWAVELLPGVWNTDTHQLDRSGYRNNKHVVPFTFEAQVRPRSGLAAKHGVTVVNAPGTVDNSYRGEIKVILRWDGHKPNAWAWQKVGDIGLAGYKPHTEINYAAGEFLASGAIHPFAYKIAKGDMVPAGKGCAYKIAKGDRIAQLVVAMVALPEPVEVADLGETDRGSGGFGSTGK